MMLKNHQIYAYYYGGSKCPSYLSIFVIIFVCIIHQPFNIECNTSIGFNRTEDLFCDTLSTTTFNLTEWLCLDYLLGVDNSFVDNKNDLAHCSCFLNVQCTQLVNNNNNNNNNNNVFEAQQSVLDGQNVWFRCYDLNDSTILDRFVQTSIRSLLKYFDKDPAKCKDMFTKNDPVSLRIDFVRSDPKNIFKFIEQVLEQTPRQYEIESLTIRESGLEQIPSWLFKEFEKLKFLNLTSNHLKGFDSDDFVDSTANHSTMAEHLLTLDLSKNQLTHVNLSQFASLRSINLSHNNLTTLSKKNLTKEVIKALEQMRTGQDRDLTLDFSIGDNPWICDYSTIWLIDLISAIVEANGHSYFYEPPKANNGNNGKPRQYAKKQLDYFRTNEPECDQPQEAKMFPFSVWKTVIETPICRNCSCYLKDLHAKAGYRYVTVNCTNRNLFSLPTSLPKNTKILDLSNNHIRNLSPLTKSHGQLSEWQNVNKVILSNNSLETLDGLDQIHSLILLDISGNLLTEIPYHIINKAFSAKIDKIGIGINPYICDCNTVKMQKWLQTFYPKILDIKQVRCGYIRPELALNETYRQLAEYVKNNRFYMKEILHINSLHLCPSGDSLDSLDILNIILAISIMLLLIKVTYDFCWQKRTGKLPLFFKINM